MTTPAKSEPRLTGWVKLGERDVEVYQPLDGQILVLTQLPRMVLKRPTDALTHFGNVLEALMVSEEDQRWAYEALISGELESTAYLQLAIDVLEYFGLQEPEQSTPRPAKKAARVPARRR
jgi:hypothetical protein